MKQPMDRELDKLTDAIIASYHAAKRTQRIGSAFLPSRDAIVEIIGELRQLVFPGFFGKLALTRANVRYHVGDLLVRLGRRLAEQIFQCLLYGAAREGNGEEPDCRQADTMARRFLRRIPHIRDMLALDAQAAYDGDPAAKSVDEVIYCYPGFYAITVYRLAHELLRLGVPLMPRIMAEHAHSVTGTDIHPGAQIGKSFFIDHATGVVIGETSRIGDNAKIYHGVTLGALSFPKDERGRIIKGLQRHPTLGDRVTIYPNATILGGATVIGSGATIGGNTYITESVPPNTVVGHKRPELSVRPKRRGRRGRPGSPGTNRTARRRRGS
ncbi:MAG: serine O-acetyltransferase [Planctomycetota bacterium]|jgi:serine O-acetyltransferase